MSRMFVCLLALMVAGCSKSDADGANGTVVLSELSALPISSADLLAKLQAKGFTLDIDPSPPKRPDATHYVVKEAGAWLTFNEAGGKFRLIMMRTVQFDDQARNQRTRDFVETLTGIILGLDAATTKTALTAAINGAPPDDDYDPRFFFGVANLRACLRVCRKPGGTLPKTDFTFLPSWQ